MESRRMQQRVVVMQCLPLQRVRRGRLDKRVPLAVHVALSDRRCCWCQAEVLEGMVHGQAAAIG